MMETKPSRLKFPVIGLLALVIGAITFNERIFYFLMAQALETRGIEITWTKSTLNLRDKGATLWDVRLAPMTPEKSDFAPLEIDQIEIAWRANLAFFRSIQSVSLKGLIFNLNDTQVHTPAYWLRSLLVSKVSTKNPKPVITCKDCRLFWSTDKHVPPDVTLDAHYPIISQTGFLLEYHGDFFLERNRSTGLIPPEFEPIGNHRPQLNWHSRGTLNGSDISFTGTVQPAPGQTTAFQLTGASEPYEPPMTLPIYSNALLEAKPKIAFSALLDGANSHNNLLLSTWDLSLDFQSTALIKPTDQHAYLDDSSFARWDEGKISFHWQTQATEETKLPIVSIALSKLNAELNFLTPETKATPARIFLSMNQLTSSLQHQLINNWVANQTHIDQMSAFSDLLAKQEYEISIGEMTLGSIQFSALPTTNKQPMTAKSVQVKRVEMAFYDKQHLNDHWAYLLANRTFDTPILQIDDLATMTTSHILHLDSKHQLESLLEFEPFQLSEKNKNSDYLFTLKSSYLNSLSRTATLNPATTASSNPSKLKDSGHPEAKLILNTSGNHCNFKTVIHLGSLNRLNDLYDLLGPTLDQANLPIYLADIFHTDLNNQSLIYLGEMPCDPNQPLAIIDKISAETPKMLVKKSTEKIQSMSPEDSTGLINRFSTSSALNELVIGELSFEPFSNRLSYDQKTKLNQMLERLKKVVSISSEVQLRIEASTNRRDIILWKNVQSGKASQDKPMDRSEVVDYLSILARQRGLHLKKILVENGIESDQIYLSLPKYDPSDSSISNLKIFL